MTDRLRGRLRDAIRRRDIVGLGLCLLGAGSVIATVGWFVATLLAYQDRSDLRAELECRYEVTNEVAQLESQRDAAFAAGLAAYAADNETALLREVAVIDAINAELVPALERRDAAVERCR